MTADQARLAVALEGRYAIERELGPGGMATVYLAQDLKHQRRVAVKVLRPELGAVIDGERFLNEIRVTAELHHPHILPLYDWGAADGFLYYVTPLAEGETLRDRLVREEPLTVGDALRIVRDAADALSYAHSQGVIHRDITPDSVLLESGHAVIADFGIARAVSAAGGAKAIGTPAYWSPEQASGDRPLDGRSDLYALGSLLYEMLAGQPPSSGPTDVPPAVPSEVSALLARMLARNPDQRFGSASQLIAALDQVRTPSGTVVLRTPAGRGRGLLVAAAVLTVLLIGAVVLWRIVR